jgi:signal transduction histidine kinase
VSSQSFSELVSLACHDIRTPLATASGFAGTLVRMGGQTEQAERFLSMIENAAAEIDAILDALSLAARIESGRYEPSLTKVDSLELARAAAGHVDLSPVAVSGSGADVIVDREPAVRAVAALALCALRHGAVERLELAVEGPVLTISPLERDAPAVVLGDQLKDLGAAIGRRALEAWGSTLRVDGASLVVTLPD